MDRVVRKHVNPTDERGKSSSKSRELPLVLNRAAGEKDIGGEADQRPRSRVAVKHPGLLVIRRLNGDYPCRLQTGLDETGSILNRVEGLGRVELGPAVLSR